MSTNEIQKVEEVAAIVEAEFDFNIKVFKFAHPMDAGPPEEIIIPVFASNTVQDLADAFAPAEDDYIIICKNGVALPSETWKITHLADGDEFVIRPSVNAVALVYAAVALLGYGSMVAAGAVAFSWLAMAAYVAIAVAGGYLIRSLTPKPDTANLGDLDKANSNNYARNPHSTQAEGLPIPIYFGRNRIYGNVISQHSSIDPADDTKRRVNTLIGLTAGPIKEIEDDTIRISDRPQADFEGVAVYSNLGTYEQSSLTGHDILKPEYAYNRKVVYGTPVEITLPDNDYTKLKIILAWSRGIYWINDTSSLSSHSSGYKVEIKPAGGAYSTLVDTTMSESTSSVVRVQLESDATYAGGAAVTINDGTSYVIKITKTTEEKSALRYGDEMMLEGVQEWLEHDLSYPGLACLAINNVDSSQVSDSLEFSAVVKGNIIGHYDGASWTYDYYNSPADVLYWLAAMPLIIGDGDGTPYSVSHNRGLAEDRIDLAKLLELHDYLEESVPAYGGGTEKRMTLNRGFDIRTTIWDTLLEVCEIARCMPVLIGGKLSFAINKPKTASQVFTLDNQLMKGFSRHRIPSAERITELEIQYKDANLDFETTTIRRQDPDAPSSLFNKATLELSGITTESEAWRYALNDLEQTKQQKWVITLKVDIESLACTIGDVIKIQTPVCVWGDNVRVSEVLSTTGIVVSTGLVASAADKIAIRTTDTVAIQERLDVYGISGVTLSEDATETTLVVGSPFLNTPAVGDIGLFGPDSIVEKNYAITRIDRNPDGFATISAIDWYDDMFLDDVTTPVLNIIPGQVPNTSSSPQLPINWNNIDAHIPSTVWSEPLNIDMPFTSQASWTSNSPGAGSIAWGAHSFFINGTTYSIAASNTALLYTYLDSDVSTTEYQKSDNLLDTIGENKHLMAINDSGALRLMTPYQAQHGLSLVPASVDTAQLVDGSIVEDKLAALSVATGKLQLLAVDSTILASNAVVETKIADVAISTAKIQLLAVDSTVLASNAVVETKLADLAVATAKLQLGAVTTNQIAANTIVAGNIAANTITAAEIFAGTITATEIAANTIVAGNIAANTLTAAEIFAGAITTTEIAADTIVAGNIAANTITAAEIFAGTITATEIAANTITANEIASETIVAGNIAAETITGDLIAATTITGEKIAATTITADKYYELRNSMVFNDHESLDATHNWIQKFLIISEMTAIQQVTLSFAIEDFRAYASAATADATASGAYTSGSWNDAVSTDTDGGGSTGVDGSGSTSNNAAASHTHQVSGNTSSDDGTGYHHHSNNFTSGSGAGYGHSHTGPSHSHTTPPHSHGITTLYHDHTIGPHSHSHTHGITYGIYEDSQTPTINYRISDGGAPGSWSTGVTVDQTEINVTSSITSAGWKYVEFKTDLRCRIRSIIVCKLDITA